MSRGSTYQHWKRILQNEKDNSEINHRFFTTKRNQQGKLIEVFYVYRLKDHIKDTIYTFGEIIEIMEKEKSNV